MAVRPIDANAMLDELRPVSFEAEHSAVLLSDVSKMMREWVERQPTLTPPNEAPPCYQPDGDGCAYQCYDGDDEPIDKCKECPLCYSDKQRHHAPPNEWVSVEEGLPEDNIPEHKAQIIVLVLTDRGVVKIKNRTYHPARYYYGKFYPERWDWGTFNDDCITHWMPLPAAPDSRPPEGEEDT